MDRYTTKYERRLHRERAKIPPKYAVLVKSERPGIVQWTREGGFYDDRRTAQAVAKALIKYHGSGKVKIEKVTA